MGAQLIEGNSSTESPDEYQVVNIIRKKLNALSDQGTEVTASECTIFRVPDYICRGREDFFRPHIVSIGPYVHANADEKKKELRAMDVVKLKFLGDLIGGQEPDIFLQKCEKELKGSELDIRKCYYQAFDGIDSTEFIQMLLLDGCFIIQYFMKWTTHDELKMDNVRWSFASILHDLLLLENQVPFRVLKTLFQKYKGTTSNESNNAELLRLILHGLLEMLGEPTDKVNINRHIDDTRHLLHLYYQHYSTSKKNDTEESPESKPRKLLDYLKLLWKAFQYIKLNFISSIFSCSRKSVPVGTAVRPAPRSIPSATRLMEARVRFKKKESANFLDITFKHGILEIPFISVHDKMTYKLANLIAFEQSTGVGCDITSYATFMGKIIDTADDVQILRHEGIMENMLASNEDVALFFNQLYSYCDLDFENHYLVQVFRDVSAYSKSKCHENIGWFLINYCKNFCVFLSLLAAVLLLVLTALQTFYSVYAYYRPPA